MEPGGGQAAATQGQDMPAGQGLGPEATAHHLYLTDVCSEEKGVLRPPGPRGAQTQGPGGFSAGRQAGTAAQGIIMAAVPSCPSLPFGLLSLPIQPSPRENKANRSGPQSVVAPQSVPPKLPQKRRAGEPEMLHRCRPRHGGCRPGLAGGDGRGCQRGEEALMDGPEK